MCQHCMDRREFATLTSAGLAAGVMSLSSAGAAPATPVEPWDPDRSPIVTGRPLRVQPVLVHSVRTPKEKNSWRSWSSVINEPAAAEEIDRIAGEMEKLSRRAEFPIKILPTIKVCGEDHVPLVHKTDHDVVLLYAATNAGLFKKCFAQDPRRDTIIFVRHKSGPTYHGYECIGTRYVNVPSPELWAKNSALNHGGPTLDDIVVDDHDEVLWRLRALYGLKNFVGRRILALGGPMGKWDKQAPKVARERYKLDIIDMSYDDLAARLKAVLADAKLRKQMTTWTDRYLAMPQTRLETKREFIERAFALYIVFKQWLHEQNAPAITINACMGTILSVTDTTACMPLSWLNDEGRLAFCESDFVAVPSGILLHYISGRPVYMHNSTFPHKATVTCAHCTGPRRMDGKRYEPTRIMTHYESDFGAAPKIDMPLGQEVCFIDPEYSSKRWLGIKGIVRANPDFAICRSQQDVEIQGDWRRLIPETRDSHWMMVYGDYLREVGYAVRKIGMTWENISGEEG
ncbi:MAG: hypothetical protein JXM70_15410 [Pirellulales bacterium]|nr:hypothetical protein [Pirellulales bacterium]